MPTEYRFDDLDLREQPARGSALNDSVTLNQNTCQSVRCQSEICTNVCCSDNCP